MARDTAVGIGAAVSRTRVDTLLAHAGLVAGTVGADDTLRSAVGRSTQVLRQTRAGRTAVQLLARGIRPAWIRLTGIGDDQLRFWKGVHSMRDSKAKA